MVALNARTNMSALEEDARPLAAEADVAGVRGQGRLLHVQLLHAPLQLLLKLFQHVALLLPLPPPGVVPPQHVE